MIEIKSFSFLHSPQDMPQQNRRVLWYVFDCRFVSDPGLLPSLQNYSGTDKAIALFLETETDLIKYLDLVFESIVITIKNYKEKKDLFDKIVLNFGCLGGIHRSVFAAEYIAQKIKTYFDDEEVILDHTRR